MKFTLATILITLPLVFAVGQNLNAQREGSRIGIEGLALSKDVGLLSNQDHTQSFQWHAPVRVWYTRPLSMERFFGEGSLGFHNRLYEVDSEIGSEGLRLRGVEVAAGLGWTLIQGSTAQASTVQLSLLGVFRTGRAKGFASEEGFGPAGYRRFRYAYNDQLSEVGAIFKARLSTRLTQHMSLTFTPRIMVTRKRSSPEDDQPRAVTKTFGGKAILDQELVCVGLVYRL